MNKRPATVLYNNSCYLLVQCRPAAVLHLHPCVTSRSVFCGVIATSLSPAPRPSSFSTRQHGGGTANMFRLWTGMCPNLHDVKLDVLQLIHLVYPNASI